MRIELFGKIPLDLVDTDTFVDMVSDWVNKNNKKRIFYLNAHGIVEALNDRTYLNILRRSDLVYADGWGPILASKLLGSGFAERVNAADFIDDFFSKIKHSKVKLYLLGNTRDVLNKAIINILKKHRNIVVCGFHHGFFSNKEESKMVQEIKLAKPNLILVGMGSPKQENFVYNNWKKLPKAVYWTVGGLFNYIAATKKRAPGWMLRLRLEWLYRFFQEPRRLWKRYTIENLHFIFLVSKFFFKKRLIKYFEI